MNFASDNCSGVHPAIMVALADANGGMVPSYAGDDLTAAAEARIREVFEAPEARVAFVATGTAANALSLATYTPPWGRVFCHAEAHIQTSEAAAPEFYSGGAKLALIEGADGRISPEALDAAQMVFGRDNVHAGRNAMLSLTNATEQGTVYAPDAVAALAERAHAGGLKVHMDGARFANAVARLGCSPAELTWRAGVDIMSFGGTKGGCMAVEAVIMFDPDRIEALGFRRMRAGHLWSKHRFLSAQMLAWLEGGLWLELAGHANRMAADLGRGLAQVEGVTLVQPVESNAVFAKLPRAVASRLREQGAVFHDWPHVQPPDAPDVTVRLVASWATEADQVSDFIAAASAAARG